MASDTVKKIKELLKQGYSGSQIAKTLHIRKQTALDIVRQIQNKPKNVKKITNVRGRKGSIELDEQSKIFTEQLYRHGYPIDFIVKLVNKKHSETSKYKIRKYIKQFAKNDADAVKSHKANMKFYKSSGKYRQHLDAKFYKETEQHYFRAEEYQFTEGSPKFDTISVMPCEILRSYAIDKCI